MSVGGGIQGFSAPPDINISVDFNAMTRAQMEEYALVNGINLSGASNNAQRREILQNAVV
jgi:hypothetical protein